MALDLCQFDEGTTCSLIDSLLQEENEEMKEDANHSAEFQTNGGLKPTLTGDKVSEQVSFGFRRKNTFLIVKFTISVIDNFRSRQ